MRLAILKKRAPWAAVCQLAMQLQLAPSLPCERVRAVRLALAHPQLLLHLGHSGQQAALAPWRGAWLRLGPELVSLLWLRVPLKLGLAAASRRVS